ncbi:DUF6879 family protein [Micromonospora sp. LOL_015]|uniref:DUF6879 family protein n=1 Tax=Micromonospora sp. LOL_015 TaxID=3345416 RepID=UPI003A87D80B
MHEVLGGDPGELLTLDDYWSDFYEHFWRIESVGFWKLERQQFFKEPGNKSWEAFVDGRWDESLRLIDEQRDDFADYYGRIARQGFVNRRVRVVEKPIIPYLQWELHLLRLRHDYGGLTNVVGPEQVAPYENGGPLPEIYTLGLDVMYEAVYDDTGVLAAARRFTDPDLIARCQGLIEGLYQQGEPLDTFFDREVATLEPPTGT